jgi:hypothetical protein
MRRTQTKGVDVLVLEGSGELQTKVDLAELPHHLSDPRSLIWCDIASTEGGQQGPNGRLLREVFGFDELTHRGLLHQEPPSRQEDRQPPNDHRGSLGSEDWLALAGDAGRVWQVGDCLATLRVLAKARTMATHRRSAWRSIFTWTGCQRP